MFDIKEIFLTVELESTLTKLSIENDPEKLERLRKHLEWIENEIKKSIGGAV